MLSFHPNQRDIGKAFLYAHNWVSVLDHSLEEFSIAVTRFAICPMLFKTDHRLRTNFLRADWIGLDFDHGLTISETLERIKDKIHILGTTKSHQIPKGNEGPCDRFRIFLKLSEPIENFLNYEETVRHYQRDFFSDGACVDAARLFWPCKEILSVKYVGKTILPQEAPKRSFKPIDAKFIKTRSIPPWVKTWLEKGCPEGERNRTVFKASIWLRKIGYEEREILELIMNSQIPISQDRSVYYEVCKTVSSGCKRAQLEM